MTTESSVSTGNLLLGAFLSGALAFPFVGIGIWLIVDEYLWHGAVVVDGTIVRDNPDGSVTYRFTPTGSPPLEDTLDVPYLRGRIGKTLDVEYLKASPERHRCPNGSRRKRLRGSVRFVLGGVLVLLLAPVAYFSASWFLRAVVAMVRRRPTG